ncbi:MAG: SCP2 sterol-binding domain-containing protein [Ferrimicrobium sp.]
MAEILGRQAISLVRRSASLQTYDLPLNAAIPNMEVDPAILKDLYKFDFLSAEWLRELRSLTERIGLEPIRMELPLRMNQLINNCPFQEEPLAAYLNTSEGILDLDLGSLENPDLTISLDYEVAKAMFIELNPQRAVEAFMAGKIVVTGDITKLMALASVFANRSSDDPLSIIMQAITTD